MTSPRALGLVLAAVLATAALVPGRAAAQESPRQQAADLAAQLMSPFCPGRLLVDCTSSQAYDLRDAIARRVEAGEPVEAVRADLVRQYGREILGAPPAEGVGLLAWLLPGLIGVVSLAGVAWTVARATRPAAAPLAAAGPIDLAVLARVEDALRDLD